MESSDIFDCAVRVKEEPRDESFIKNDYEMIDEKPDLRNFQLSPFPHETFIHTIKKCDIKLETSPTAKIIRALADRLREQPACQASWKAYVEWNKVEKTANVWNIKTVKTEIRRLIASSTPHDLARAYKLMLSEAQNSSVVVWRPPRNRTTTAELQRQVPCTIQCVDSKCIIVDESNPTIISNEEIMSGVKTRKRKECEQNS
ncbi:hypothetical protein TKK_0007482 [Trichogramma kaykai]